MGEWQEVKRTVWRDDPCFGCQGGSFNISQKWENGKLYERFDYCQETCQRYKDYWEGKSEPFFGQNIRETIATLGG